MALEDAFRDLNIATELAFHPRQGFESLRGAENHRFYVNLCKTLTPALPHREDASKQVSGFPHCAYKKYSGWNAATAAWDNIRAPITPPVRPITPPPEPGGRVRRTQHLEDQLSTSASTRRAAPTVPRDSSRAAISAPSTPTGSRTRKVLYVYSGNNDTTIYADEAQASSDVRRGLADGSFRKVNVTPRVTRAFKHATDSALEVLDISDFSDSE
ncbi:hypothetical protein K438DRAFT_1998168 [Mycena galopus ATCC 62051]|nr:hypothetical protein K438DRAFT_1998168 [Mycena galopus ATCC 62051]